MGNGLSAREWGTATNITVRACDDTWEWFFDLLDAVDSGDVRVIQRRQHLGLALKSQEAVRICSGDTGQNLDRDVAFEAGVACAVDLPHPAGTDDRDDFIHSNARARRETHNVAVIVDCRISVCCCSSGPLIRSRFKNTFVASGFDTHFRLTAHSVFENSSTFRIGPGIADCCTRASGWNSTGVVILGSF